MPTKLEEPWILGNAIPQIIQFYFFIPVNGLRGMGQTLCLISLCVDWISQWRRVLWLMLQSLTTLEALEAQNFREDILFTSRNACSDSIGACNLGSSEGGLPDFRFPRFLPICAPRLRDPDLFRFLPALSSEQIRETPCCHPFCKSTTVSRSSSCLFLRGAVSHIVTRYVTEWGITEICLYKWLGNKKPCLW